MVTQTRDASRGFAKLENSSNSPGTYMNLRRQRKGSLLLL